MSKATGSGRGEGVSFDFGASITPTICAIYLINTEFYLILTDVTVLNSAAPLSPYLQFNILIPGHSLSRRAARGVGCS